ncbi:hypothetical protein KUTeg_006963 [Tegillarca granosa]|uniref:Uncharacterized protein n=1 Tax=Tegillarca granosa TaxID=220873 RepID=A0ABQ9FBV2_TEGGR|nr:hypothetical protein KUTeg_006963 [Tegillarca granosa]
MEMFPTAECAHHGEPCGGIAPEKPLRVFEGGKQAYVKWQQNVNVYDIGNPGIRYMDISIAPFDSTNFEVLAVVHDQNTFGQFTRQNYSALVVVPNQECEHCVLRVRYKTHRPGEPVYVQCADVSIVTTKSAAHLPVSNFPSIIKDYRELSKGFELQNRYPTRKQRADGLSLYGFAYNPYEINRLQYVKIDLTSGMKEGIIKYDFGIGFGKKSWNMPSKRKTDIKDDTYYFVADSVLSVNVEKNRTTLLFNDGADMDSPPLSIIEVNIKSGDISRKQPIKNVPSGQAINAIFPNGDGYFTFSVREAQQKGEHNPVSFF